MGGRGDRGAAPRLVFGATVRMDFRGANGAKTCANREDDRLVILFRCEHNGVWLKTSTISNYRTQPSCMRLPRVLVLVREIAHCKYGRILAYFLSPIPFTFFKSSALRNGRAAIIREAITGPTPGI